MKHAVNVAHARNQKRVYQKIQKDRVCPFCVDFSKKKKDGELQYHTKPILIHGSHWAVTENFDPYKGTKYHFMFVHRKHITSFSELSPAALIELTKIVKGLEKELLLPAGVFLLRFGDTNYTGGSVAHLHAHFLLGGKKTKKTQEPLFVFAGYKKTGK